MTNTNVHEGNPKVGEIVWIKLVNGHGNNGNEEGGTVLKLNVKAESEGVEAGEEKERDHIHTTPKNGSTSACSSMAMDERSSCILVRSFDGVDSVVPLSRCRFLGNRRDEDYSNDGNDKGFSLGRRNLRRSTRSRSRSSHSVNTNTAENLGISNSMVMDVHDDVRTCSSIVTGRKKEKKAKGNSAAMDMDMDNGTDVDTASINDQHEDDEEDDDLTLSQNQKKAISKSKSKASHKMSTKRSKSLVKVKTNVNVDDAMAYEEPRKLDPEECAIENPIQKSKPRSRSRSASKSASNSAKKRKKKDDIVPSPAQAQANMNEPSSPYFQEKPTKKIKIKAGGSRKARIKQPRKVDMHDDDHDINDETGATLKSAAKPKSAAKRSTSSSSAAKNPVAKKRPQKPKSKSKPVPKKNDIDVSPQPGKADGNGGLDQGATYIIERAKTARSTCKRCDIRIQKNQLRVGHRPLFRGKPGYRVFKHLHCIVFSEDIVCAEDIVGYDRLEDQDYDLLRCRIVESRKEIEKEKEELDADELVQTGFEGVVRSSPKGLNANLLPFQAEGASWMYCQETNSNSSDGKTKANSDETSTASNKDVIRGGILADEMGMGKTLQTIATILDNRPRLQMCVPGGKYPPYKPEEKDIIDEEEELWKKSLKEWKHEMDMNDVHESILPKGGRNGQPEGGARAGTLVICPLIALSQWKSEIEKFCEGNALTVCTYHGPDRATTTPKHLFIKYDIVLTTYQVLEADFRKMVSPNKVKCPNCGSRFKVDKLRIHLKYFCGEGAQRTEAQARTIRNSERRSAPRRRRGSLPAARGGDGQQKKGKGKDETKQKKIMKNTVKVKSMDDYASESDLSIKEEEVVELKKGRSPRGAALKAQGRLKGMNTYTKRTAIESDSDESFSLASDNDSGSDFDENNTPTDKYESSSSEADVAMSRAVAKQAQAMKRAKGGGKKKFLGEKKSTKKKSLPKKKDKQKAVLKKGQKNNKKKKNGDTSSGGDSSSSSEDDSVNPEDLIDMDALVAEAMAGAKMSNLHSVCWWRIVLDEAHMIKSRSSQTSHAAYALTGINRWCLSGTPLQNRVGEFYSLIRFLRLDPMAHYMCRAKGCGCKQIHYRMMHGKCRTCGHGSVQHFSHFNKHVLNPIQRDGYSHDGRRAMFTLKNEVLDKCLLRRTKETHAEEMNLPPRMVIIKAVRLHPIEEDFYNALYTQTTSTFNDYVDGGTLLNNYAHIFDLLMRMRQSVAHPYLVVYSKKGVNGASESSLAVSNGRVDCHLCSEPPTERVVSSCCQTAFCKSCVLDYMELSNSAETQCPQCNQPFTIDLNQVEDDPVDDSTLKIEGNRQTISTFGLPSLKELPHVATGSILRRIDLTKFATSTKIEALVKELVNMRKNSPGSKAIVFSQFVNMLDLIRWRLHSDPFLGDIGLNARALHGGMNAKSRDAVLKDFREDPNIRVLLMSLKAGGVALNLTVANHVYLMDPWWNPAAELQAIDRTHRLGQYRPIRAVRFIAENTVEERILQLQEKKRLVFDGTVGRDAGSLKMLTTDDMKSLFA